MPAAMRSYIIVATLLCVGIFLNIYWRENLNAIERYVQLLPPPLPLPLPLQKPDSSAQEIKMKTMLLWTTRYGDGSWMIPHWGFDWDGQKYSDLRDMGCDQDSYRCTITSNRTYLEDQSHYDGILFHQGDIDQLNLPNEGTRKENQVYIYNTLETYLTQGKWGNDNYDPIINNNFFNVTMSYSSQADIHTPYGEIVQISPHPIGEELVQFIASFGEQNARNGSNKTAAAVILVSNCDSRSDREKVLSDLGKVIQVDIFGACGMPAPGGGYDLQPEEHRRMAQPYQFYLSFENSLCDDYVSEKFFNIINGDTIPVVMNGANMSRIAPKQSYIDVKDFKTIRELGDYLNKVSSDPALYASYFWWKQFYEVNAVVNGRHFVKTFCAACRYLHLRTSGGEPRVVEDLYKEVVEGRCRAPPIITYLDQEN